ncbi:SDR family oxidoreductase [Glutamicibacter protophormiae]|uniref:SDR family oxidoreductase n=1 Tax=Glutamicibacter protophormiae TaxID=37930 RepID=UPI002A838A49|nr:SDR family oxidoreductase [Glutamicibacter protophormiae]WPR64646.1 SDR family oxidoreductase [Glutamicibacter protophormiae]WPR68142.1 SDR family oxidoreductase [Glutamicibacter protophormiae]
MKPSALITGATGGIGHAIAGALAPTHHLFLAGRNIEALQLVAASFPSAMPLLADLGFPGGMDQLAAQISSLDVLVHSAGILRMGTVEETAQNDWEQSMQVNVLAPVELTRALLPALRRAHGHVFMINSGLGHRTIAGSGAYSASKFAMKAFADTLRLEEASNGLKVTSIHPGRVATPMQEQLHSWEEKAYDAENWVRPEQVAQALMTALALGGRANLDSIDINPSPRPKA